jgi:polyhydroxyalkanoate synthesis regulator phasin
MATGTVAKGAATVAQTVAQGAVSTVQSAAGAAQNVASNAQNELEKSPEVADIMRKRDQVVASIKAEAAKIMQQTGVTPEKVKAQAQTAGYQIQDAVKDVMQNPSDAERIFNETLTRIMNQGQSFTNQADQQAIIDVMVQRGNVTEDQARQALDRWQNGLRNTQQQLDYVTQQAKSRVNEVRNQAEAKVEDVKADAERIARETAQATTEAISKLALAAFAAIVIGIIAAGIGGYVGAPQDLPTARVNTSMQINTNTIHLFS